MLPEKDPSTHLKGAPLQHYQEALKYIDNHVVFIAESHVDPSGRLIVQELIKAGKIKTLFLEYSPKGAIDLEGGDGPKEFEGFGEYLNKEFQKCSGMIATGQNKIALLAKIKQYMPLSKEHASPSLYDLAELAVNHGIQVIAADPKLFMRTTTDFANQERNKASAQYIISKITENPAMKAHSLVLVGYLHCKPRDGSKSMPDLIQDGGYQVHVVITDPGHKT